MLSHAALWAKLAKKKQKNALAKAACLAFGLLTAFPSFGTSKSGSFGWTAKMSPKLQLAYAKSPRSAIEILVYMREQADLKGAQSLQSKEMRGRFVTSALQRTAELSQKELRSYLDAKHFKYTSFYLGNILLVEPVNADAAREIAARADVSRVLGNPRVHGVLHASDAQLTPDHSLFAVGANIMRTGADRVWQMGYTGEGIIIAGQDTGVSWNHPALVSHYRGHSALISAGTTSTVHNYSWHDSIHTSLADQGAFGNPCGYNLAAPCDDHGHGTHTMGTMVGDDGVGNQVGMAPGAKWIACRNMDAGVGKPSTYLECFQYFLAPWPYGGDSRRDANPDYAPHIISNSWECLRDEGCEGDEFIDVLPALKSAGIMVVAAAGNNGPGCSTIENGPASSSSAVFAVGAFDHRSDTVAAFSSRGPSTLDGSLGPDLSAPGVNIRSTIPGGGYSSASWSGTSMAAPHAAGAVALLWSARPELVGHVDETIAVLTSHAERKTTSQTCGSVAGTNVPNNTYGYGFLNVLAALQAQP